MRLGGLADVAQELGVSRQRASQLRQRGDFPIPVGEVASGPIWDLDEVLRWSGSGLRRGPGRPRASTRQTTILNDRFELEDEMIGRGGFADVYRALDRREAGASNAIVAVKVLRELDDKEVRARFARELRLVSSFSHPNVVPVLDYGEDDDGPIWYAMPLAKGSLDDEKLEFIGNNELIVDLMRQLCAGLEFVHAAGVYHRDLKPANVLRMRSGTWAISDFGLARERDRQTTALTSTLRTGFATYIYAAPEVWKGAKYAEAPADVFSLGKVLHELVTGDPPAPGTEPDPHLFSPIIRKATRARPADRYSSVSALLDDLEALISRPVVGWRPNQEVIARLSDRLRDDRPDDAILKELFDLALLSENDDGVFEDLLEVMPLLSAEGIQYLWDLDKGGWRSIFSNYAEFVARGVYAHRVCDDVADFFDRAVQVTRDGDVLRAAVGSLIRLASTHERWRLQDTLLTILQRIRTSDDALVALEGVRKGSREAIRWAFTGFALRTLHPLLRSGIEEFIDE